MEYPGLAYPTDPLVLTAIINSGRFILVNSNDTAVRLIYSVNIDRSTVDRYMFIFGLNIAGTRQDIIDALYLMGYEVDQIREIMSSGIDVNNYNTNAAQRWLTIFQYQELNPGPIHTVTIPEPRSPPNQDNYVDVSPRRLLRVFPNTPILAISPPLSPKLPLETVRYPVAFDEVNARRAYERREPETAVMKRYETQLEENNRRLANVTAGLRPYETQLEANNRILANVTTGVKRYETQPQATQLEVREQPGQRETHNKVIEHAREMGYPIGFYPPGPVTQPNGGNFIVGDIISHRDKKGQVTTGRINKVNPKTYDIGLIRIARDAVRAATNDEIARFLQNPENNLPFKRKEDFRLGQFVQYVNNNRIERGTITKLNKEKATVRANGRDVKVPYVLLEAV